ncbi:MAG: polysaccharide deacetylase family protein, partial [Bacillales bacterium]
MESPAESRTTTNRKERGRELGSKRRFYILGVMIVIAVLLFISGTANRNSYGKAGLTGDEPPAVWRMSYFYGKINAASGQKGLLAEHGIHGSRLQIKDGGSAGNKTVEREKKGSTVREKAKKDADHRDDTGENSRLDGKSAEREKMKFKRVALTFDDGPHPSNTDKVLKILAEEELLATFFVVGDMVEVLPGRMAARIRGMQSHKQPIERAEPGGRVALNLTGVSAGELRRGDVVV